MAMSKRSGGEKQEDIWIAHTELAVAPGHPFYKRLNELLEGAGFDELVEGLCARFYHARLGRPSLRPGVYFRARYCYSQLPWHIWEINDKSIGVMETGGYRILDRPRVVGGACPAR
jgi:hypothetical protein